MALDLLQNFVSSQYLENKVTQFHQILHMHSYWQDLAWDSCMSFFAHLYHSYARPWFIQNFVSAQYLENKLTESHQILYMHLYWQNLAWDCCTSFCANLYQSYGPWSTPKFCLSSTSWEHIGRISPNFTYAFLPGPVPYFRGDWSWNNFYSHSPPFRWFIQEGLLSVTSESMCTNYCLTACSSLPRKKVWLGELTERNDHSCWLGT